MKGEAESRVKLLQPPFVKHYFFISSIHAPFITQVTLTSSKRFSVPLIFALFRATNPFPYSGALLSPKTKQMVQIQHVFLFGKLQD